MHRDAGSGTAHGNEVRSMRCCGATAASAALAPRLVQGLGMRYAGTHRLATGRQQAPSGQPAGVKLAAAAWPAWCSQSKSMAARQRGLRDALMSEPGRVHVELPAAAADCAFYAGNLPDEMHLVLGLRDDICSARRTRISACWNSQRRQSGHLRDANSAPGIDQAIWRYQDPYQKPKHIVAHHEP